MKQRKFGTTLKTLTALALMSGSASVMAAGISCGSGKILEINEGGWARSDLVIRVEGDPATAVAGTMFVSQYVRYRSDQLDTEQLRALRSLAYLAFSGGYTITTKTHSENCSNAAEIGIQ